MPEDRRILGLDTENGRTPHDLRSVQLVGDGVAEYLRREPGDVTGNGLRRRAAEVLRSLAPAEAWSCSAWYDALNLGWISPGITARRTSHGYTEFRHQLVPGVTLNNTLSISPASVAVMGDEVGLPKLPFDPENREYAMRDAEIVYRWIREVIDGLAALGGRLYPTAGRTASALWRARGTPPWIVPGHLARPGRAAYRGGRVEVFRFGIQGAAEVWDISSAFPAAMVEAPFPADGFVPSRDVDVPGLYDVEVEDPEGDYGLLPVRTSGTVIYPKGRFRGLYYSEELRGVRVRRLFAGWTATTWVRPFDDYVYPLYAEKERPGSPLYLAAKILLNALYGVLGQRGSASGLTTIRKGSKVEGVVVAPGVVAYSFDNRAPKRANVLWAGMITARVRARLRETIAATSRRLLYCDTDSVFLSGHGGRDVPEGPRQGLGAWKLKDRVTAMELVAPKVYGYKVADGWRWKAKGIRSAHAEEFIKKGNVRWRAPVPVLEAAIRGVEAGAWLDVERAIAQSYQGRRVLGNGRTRPWTVPDDHSLMEFRREAQRRRLERSENVLAVSPG